MKKWLCPPFVYWRCWFLIARLHSMFASLQVWTTKNCWYLLLKACCSSTWARGAKLKFVWGLSRIEHVEDVRSQHQKAWPCLERFLSVGCDRNIQLDWPPWSCVNYVDNDENSDTAKTNLSPVGFDFPSKNTNFSEINEISIQLSQLVLYDMIYYIYICIYCTVIMIYVHLQWIPSCDNWLEHRAE